MAFLRNTVSDVFNASRIESLGQTALQVVYHLKKFPGNPGWKVNEKRLNFGPSQWTFPGATEDLKR